MENIEETAFLSHREVSHCVEHERKWWRLERGERKKGEKSECVTAGQLY